MAGLAASALPKITFGIGSNHSELYRDNEPSIRLALIGKGKMGSSDTRTALRVPGVKLVAVCDLYNARLQDAKREWGNTIFTTRDYTEVLSRDDVDAVIIGTPDHWHQKISIDAMLAGKHVYCEKPVIHKISEGKDLIRAQQKSGVVFMSGSQGMSSLGNHKAKQLLHQGAIGQLNFIEAAFTSSPRRHCSSFENVSQSDIWWEQYIKHAPKRPFDPSRFFCWRLWRDYGTGLAGDLFVHVLSSLHYITETLGPEKVYTTGNVDGIGDTPGIMLGLFDYPARNGADAFKVSLTANAADGVSKKWGSTDFTITGNEGTMRVEWDKVTLRKNKKINIRDFEKLSRLGNKIDLPVQKNDNEVVFNEEGYKDCHFDHVQTFFHAIQNKAPVDANVLFAVQTAAPAILCYESYLTGKPILWDPEKLKEKKG